MKSREIILKVNVLKIVLTPLFLLFFSPLFSQDPLFSFIHLTDLHLASDSTSTYPNANCRFKNLVNHLNTDSVKNKIDFAVISGDIVQVSPYSETLLVYDLNYANSVLSELEIPYYPLIGNHENNWAEGNTVRENIFNNFSGYPASYTFTFQNYLFIMLNNTSGYYNNVPVIYARNKWLKNILLTNTDKRIVLATHISPLKMRTNFPDWAFISPNDELQTIIAENPNIELVLSGHTHLNSRLTKYGKDYLCTSALASYPFEYRIFKVYNDSISIETLATPEPGINIWKDSTDNDHITDTIYAKGNESERNFIHILPPLPPKVVSPEIFIQGNPAEPLSASGFNLTWYTSLFDTIGSELAPVPNTDFTDTLTYYVSQADSNNLESQRSKIDAIILDKNFIDGIHVFPNPSTGIANIYSLDLMNSKVSIYSYDGKLVFFKNIENQNSEVIDISKIPPGFYIMNIEGDNYSIRKKIIKT